MEVVSHNCRSDRYKHMKSGIQIKIESTVTQVFDHHSDDCFKHEIIVPSNWKRFGGPWWYSFAFSLKTV